MVALPVLATLDRKPRQGRKAATVLIDAGAEINRWGHLLLYVFLLASSLFFGRCAVLPECSDTFVWGTAQSVMIVSGKA